MILYFFLTLKSVANLRQIEEIYDNMTGFTARYEDKIFASFPDDVESYNGTRSAAQQKQSLCMISR